MFTEHLLYARTGINVVISLFEWLSYSLENIVLHEGT